MSSSYHAQSEHGFCAQSEHFTNGVFTPSLRTATPSMKATTTPAAESKSKMDTTPKAPYSWRSDNAKNHLAWFLHEGVRYEVTGNQIEHYIVDNGSIVLIVSSIDSDNAYMPQIAMSENKRMSLITESYKALRESRK